MYLDTRATDPRRRTTIAATIRPITMGPGKITKNENKKVYKMIPSFQLLLLYP